MKMFFKSLAKAGLALMLVAFMAPAHADELSSAKTQVNAMATHAIGVISNKSLSEAQKKSQFTAILQSNFDVKTIGKFALGRYYRLATPAQQTEYNRLFQTMVVEVYNSRFKEYSGQTVTVVGARKDSTSGDIVVNSQINPTDGTQPIPVDWRMRGGKVIDVFVTGVSMSQTQRDDFASVIQKGGGKIEALLDYLRQKCAQA